MSHREQQDFIALCKIRFPEYFVERNVVDFGSLDINGSNRQFFNLCNYTGVDIGPGKGVDIVCKADQFSVVESQRPDVVISTEMLEHDPEWPYSLFNMYQVLKSGGMMLITCASPGRAEHGTKRTSPQDSPLTVAHSDRWANYYKNIRLEDFMKQMRPGMFTHYQIGIEGKHFDLQFIGIKK
jgi:hypothetical protein